MEIKTLLSSLYQKLRLGIKPGLERTFKLANYLNNPQNNYKTIHLAGTNGKGACSSLLASLLIEQGYKVGLYTSPHFFDFNERIRVNGKMINDNEIIDIYKKLEPKAEEAGATFFEITTLLTFEYFSQKKVDYAIIETGMGGRFDSTNIITPELSIITSIGMDHSEFLGDTIEKIAAEKAGIIKHNTPVYVSNNIQKSAAEVIRQSAEDKNAEFNTIDSKKVFDEINYKNTLNTTIIYEGNSFNLDLPGKNQASNLALVLSSLKSLKENIKLDSFIINNALTNLYQNTGYFGRMQLINKDPKIIIDISHNEESIQNIIETLKLHDFNKKINILFTCMKEKNYKLIIDKLSKVTDTLYITKSNNPRNIDIELLEAYCKSQNIKYVSTRDCNEAFRFIEKRNQDFLITGSFFLIEKLRGSLQNYIQIDTNA